VGLESSELRDLAGRAFSEFGNVPMDKFYAENCAFHELPKLRIGLDAFNAADGLSWPVPPTS
jgi:hypothetical protein